MNTVVKRISETAGLAPGTPIPVGIEEGAPSRFVVANITEGHTEFNRYGSLENKIPELEQDGAIWIDVQGYGGVNSIQSIFAALNIHPLFQEDILNTRQRTKLEVLDGALLVTAKKLYATETGRVHSEQVSLLLKDKVVVTFQTANYDCFDGVRKRLNTFKGDQVNPGYVLYSLLDNLVDNYYIVVESLQLKLDRLEKELLSNDESVERATLSLIKRDVSLARRVVWPMKNVLLKLSEDKEQCFPDNIDPYFADLRDHLLQLDEACEICHDEANNVIQLNMDNINLRTNAIMKSLALISTIFLPLTFVAGVYGMNFKFMPELNITWGYPMTLGMMAVIALLLYRSFKQRHWLS